MAASSIAREVGFSHRAVTKALAERELDAGEQLWQLELDRLQASLPVRPAGGNRLFQMGGLAQRGIQPLEGRKVR